MNPCDCKENFVCHPVEGCVCRQGFTGKECDQLLISARTTEREETTNAGSMTAGVMVAFLFVSIIILIILYYKRRVKNLKTQIDIVTYTADPSSPPGKSTLSNFAGQNHC